jgi:hypothetical protein
MDDALLVALAARGAAARAPLGTTGSAAIAGDPRKIVVGEPEDAVVGPDDLKTPEAMRGATLGSFTEAEEARRAHARADARAARLQVVGGHEVLA